MTEGQSVKLIEIRDKGLVINCFVNLPITMKILDRGTVQIVSETHVVDQLSCNMLISNNILRTNHMDISWACPEAGGKDVIRIGTAYVHIQAIAIQKSRRRQVGVYLTETTLIKTGTGKNLPIKHKLLLLCFNRYLFVPEPDIDPSIGKWESVVKAIMNS